jgi:hypothetical protein
MAKKKSPPNKKKREAILKELESVRSLLNEESNSKGSSKTGSKATTKESASKKVLEEIEKELKEVDLSEQIEGDIKKDENQEYQIPLLDPAKPTTFELDFSKKEKAPEAEKPVNQAPAPADIPTVDDITESSSLFEDDIDEGKDDYQESSNVVTQAQLQNHAQLIIQDLLNDAITEIEDKLDDWIPKLEEKLKKKLEKAMDKHIQKSLSK